MGLKKGDKLGQKNSNKLYFERKFRTFIEAEFYAETLESPGNMFQGHGFRVNLYCESSIKK